MLEIAVIAARIIQFLAATVLFGTPLFFLYGLTSTPAAFTWPKPLLLVCAGGLVVGALGSLLAQTATMAGDPGAAIDRDTLISVLQESSFGLAIMLRLAAAIVALAATATMRPERPLWSTLALVGAFSLASFAWSGHGAAEDGVAGWVHAAADILHLLAAGTWLGALVALSVLLLTTGRSSEREALGRLHHALARFSGVGSGVVATILVSGLINSWFLIGLSGVLRMGDSAYGRLVLAKLAMFAGMLALAGLNRWRLAPALDQGLAHGDPWPAVSSLRRSVIIEAVAGLAILLIVAGLGTLEPVSAQ